ncbi:hypothetical protein CCR96_08285 [Halochromatium roseum]|nr:hypothetical protein [Halochromatium roseum]
MNGDRCDGTFAASATGDRWPVLAASASVPGYRCWLKGAGATLLIVELDVDLDRRPLLVDVRAWRYCRGLTGGRLIGAS